ncbi:glycosyltransferase family 15 protein [Peniophora sp. CONT]|nr:glycosyltransferase family 15 protein [Peniophora sp. CONT]
MPTPTTRLARSSVLVTILALAGLSLLALSSSKSSALRARVPDAYYWIPSLQSLPFSSPDSSSSKTRISEVDVNVPAVQSPLARRKANATIVMLARNSDVDGVVQSVRDMEDRFNRWHGYPWTFLNDEDFSDEFKLRVKNLISSPVEFGTVPREHWVQPDWIDETRASASREQMRQENVIYGDSLSYRNMCRYNSGFFFRHPLLQKYRYYWRVEPDVHFHCDTRFDPFLFMADHNKTYGFTITMYEFQRTIETLWDAVKEFSQQYPHHLSPDNALRFLSDDGGQTYNLCHFWSNFEIADMDLWRSPAYMEFFDFLDKKGGFYYERWGDAPVHSIAAALFSKREQIHFFREIGYEHNPYMHCPAEEDLWERGRCSCQPQRSFDYNGYSCLAKWDAVAAR